MTRKSDDPPRAVNNATDDDVGYSKPPKRTRFKKGRSGNPKGRPKGAKNRKKIVADIAYEKHRADDDAEVWRSTLEIMVLVVRQHAAKGNRRAIRAWHAYAMKYDPQETAQRVGFLIVPERESSLEEAKEGLAKFDEWQRDFIAGAKH